jgi:RHS repeat-associated protein
VQKTEIATGNVTLYSYDFRNRLIEVETKSSGGIVLSDVHYVYDVFDRRIVAEINGVKTVTVYNWYMAWADYDASGNVLTRYLAGAKLDQWIARWQPGSGTAWFLTDRLDSVRDLINGAGHLIDHVDYTSFGGIALQSNASVSGRFLFTGLAYDPITGLYETVKRWLSPDMMRFVSQDPGGLKSNDPNLYRYALNSPTDQTDPTGLDVATAVIEEEIDLEIIAHAAILGLAISYRLSTLGKCTCEVYDPITEITKYSSSWPSDPVECQLEEEALKKANPLDNVYCQFEYTVK